MQSQLQRNEDGIKKLNDSLNVLNSNLQMCQSKLATLQQKQNELESDKVGVKTCSFIWLYFCCCNSLSYLLSKNSR